MTHGGSGFGHSLADIRTLAPQAEIIEGETFTEAALQIPKTM
ncbi:MAG: hypothetical protein ACLU99_13800 [Alphaproteobacteria bacterium]